MSNGGVLIIIERWDWWQRCKEIWLCCKSSSHQTSFLSYRRLSKIVEDNETAKFKKLWWIGCVVLVPLRIISV